MKIWSLVCWCMYSYIIIIHCAIWLFQDRGPYHIETSPLICSANQWNGFYMIMASVMNKLKQIRLRYHLQSLLRIFNCCTDAETTDKNGNVSHNHHLLDCDVWSFYMGTNASFSLLFGRTTRAVFLIHFFLHLFFLDFFPTLATLIQYFLVFLW